MTKKRKQLLLLTTGIIIIGVFFILLKQLSTPFHLNLDTSSISYVKIVSRGETAIVRDDTEITPIVQNMRSLVLKTQFGTGMGQSYELIFYDKHNDVISSFTIKSRNLLQGYLVVEGEIDFDLLESLWKKYKN